MKRTREDFVDWALEIIGIVDYDIQKESEFNIEETGQCDLVEELADFLERTYD